VLTKFFPLHEESSCDFREKDRSSARRPGSTKHPKGTRMSHDLALKHYRATIARIKAAPQDSSIALANANLNANLPVWAGGGVLDVAGFVYYTMSLNVALTNFTPGAKSVSFAAKGLSWIIAATTCQVVGMFGVDPATVGGDCLFQLEIIAAGGGATILTLYSSAGLMYGSFVGPGEGLGAAIVSGSGTLTVS
jgi:hypothetical protein